MDEAAKKIQALYRGHSVRNSMNWQLPSGRTLYQTLEEARRRAFLSDGPTKSPLKLESHNYPSILKTNFHSVTDSNVNDISPKTSSTESLIDEALVSSRALLLDAERSMSHITKKRGVSPTASSVSDVSDTC